MDPFTTPLRPPPLGVVSDFHSISSLQVAYITLFAVTYSIATILVILRLYTGFILIKHVKWDSLFLVLSWLATLSFAVCSMAAMPNGFGRHVWDVNIDQFQKYFAIYPAMAITYFWPPAFAKLSLLCIYHEIDKKMGFRYCWLVVGAISIVPTIVVSILVAGPCDARKPESALCLSGVIIGQATTNILSDILLILMPIPMVISLHMPRRKKITVGLLLTFGSSVIIFSIIRSAFIQKFIQDPDITWTACSVAMWSICELTVGIICNALAMMQPFMRRYLPGVAKRMFGSSAKGQSGYSRNNNGRSAPTGPHASTTIVAGTSAFGGRRTGHGRGGGGDDYVLHSISKAETPTGDDEDAKYHRGRDVENGKIKITSEYVITESTPRGPLSRCKDDASSESERRIMYDSA